MDRSFQVRASPTGLFCVRAACYCLSGLVQGQMTGWTKKTVTIDGEARSWSAEFLMAVSAHGCDSVSSLSTLN